MLERPAARPLTRSLLSQSLLSVSLLTAAACKVGPDYQAPVFDTSPGWHAQIASGLAADVDVDQRWWETFEDPVLDALVARAEGSLDLEIALARVAEASALRRIARGNRAPNVDAVGGARRNQLSSTSANQNISGFNFDPNEIYELGVEASWELDLWGRVRRLNEVARAELDAAQEAYRGAIVIVRAEVARTYVEARLAQERLRIAQRNLVVQERTLDLAASRVDAGLAPDVDVARAATTLHTTRAEVPNLRAQLDASLYRLAVLVGEAPGAVHEMLTADGSIPTAPSRIAVGLPAQLLRRRPDVRQAERDLAAQTARIGLQTAELYPRFDLAGALGAESAMTSNLFQSNSRTWSVGANVRWTLWNRGRILGAIALEDARAERLAATYERTVLEALEEVEGALNVHVREQLRNAALQEAVDHARDSLSSIESLYEEGLVDYQAVLDVQRTLLSLEDLQALSQGRITTNAIGLYRSLGGGWAERPAAAPGAENRDPDTETP